MPCLQPAVRQRLKQGRGLQRTSHNCTDFNGDCLAPKLWQVLGCKGKTNGKALFWAVCAISIGSQSLCQSCPHVLIHLGLRSSSRAAAGGGWALSQDNLCQRVPLLPAVWDRRKAGCVLCLETSLHRVWEQSGVSKDTDHQQRKTQLRGCGEG